MPELSHVDKRFCNRVWRTKRSTTLGVGLDSGTGLGKKTVTDEEYEVRGKVIYTSPNPRVCRKDQY